MHSAYRKEWQHKYNSLALPTDNLYKLKFWSYMYFESQSLPAPSPLQETQDHTLPLSILLHFNTLNKTPSSKT